MAMASTSSEDEELLIHRMRLPLPIAVEQPLDDPDQEYAIERIVSASKVRRG